MFWIGLGIGILVGLVLEIFLLVLGIADIHFYDTEGNEITNTKYRKAMRRE